MARSKPVTSPSAMRVPKLPVPRLHKPSGQARIRYLGREFYLGAYGSPDAQRRYSEVLSQIVAGMPPEPLSKLPTPQSDATLSVNELCVAFLKHARQHYRRPDGKLTSEYHCLTSAVAPLTDLHGLTPVAEFGPNCLKAVRQVMVDRGWCRRVVNAAVGRIRRVFRYGVECELVDPAVLQRLEAVAPLRSGRTTAPDHPPRQALAQQDIDLVKQHVSPLVHDLIDLQLLTGTRPGELLSLTTGLIDRSGAVWVATLLEHKTRHHGQRRSVRFGPRAQLILKRYLNGDPHARLFCITRCAYCRAITRGCELAYEMPDELRNPKPRALTPEEIALGLKSPALTAGELAEIRKKASAWRREHCWSPHWLRHTAATAVRDEFGLEAAQAMLGHAKPDMTSEYSRKLDKLAGELAARIG